jgi:hypothetical protein
MIDVMQIAGQWFVSQKTGSSGCHTPSVPNALVGHYCSDGRDDLYHRTRKWPVLLTDQYCAKTCRYY